MKLGLVVFFVSMFLGGCSKGFQVAFTVNPISQVENKQELDQKDFAEVKDDSSWF